MRSKSSGSVRIFYPKWTRGALIQRLRDRLPLLGDCLPLVRVVLFGSYAQGKATAASDVDLLVVYDGEQRDDAYILVRKALDVRGLEPLVYARSEYAVIRSSLDRMSRNGVVLFSRASDAASEETVIDRGQRARSSARALRPAAPTRDRMSLTSAAQTSYRPNEGMR
jgi:uncharacterized protein